MFGLLTLALSSKRRGDSLQFHNCGLFIRPGRRYLSFFFPLP